MRITLVNYDVVSADYRIEHAGRSFGLFVDSRGQKIAFGSNDKNYKTRLGCIGLKDENWSLDGNWSLYPTDKTAVKVLETVLSNLETVKAVLLDKTKDIRSKIQKKEEEISNLDKLIDSFSKNGNETAIKNWQNAVSELDAMKRNMRSMEIEIN